MSGSVQYRVSSKDLNSETVEVSVKEEMTSNEEDLLLEEFIPNNHPTSFDDDIKIKQEEMDYHDHEDMSTSDVEDDSRLKTLPGILLVDCSSVKATKKDMHAFNLDLLQCEEDCYTCQKYIRILFEHVRSSHGPSEPIQDPLHIDPLNIDHDIPPHAEHSSPVQFKCEVDENSDKMDCSQEDSMLNSEGNPEFEAKSVSESKKRTKSSQQHKRFRCSECDKSFSSQGNLNVHKKIHTGERRYKCDVCEKTFSRLTHLTVHKGRHTGEEPYKCEVCEKCFSAASDLTSHKRIHTGERPYKCEVCERRFAHSGDLIKHKRIHTGERPFKCEVCERSFAQSGDLTKHKRIHSGERPFQCEECEKSFARSSDLTGHMRSHTGERPYKCSVCNMSFTLSNNFAKPMRRHSAADL